MAEIRPFPGLRFDEGIVGDLASVMTPPYDVIDAAAQEEYYRSSPYNIIRLELGKQFPADSAQANRYSRAVACLEEWLHTGVLRIERAPAIYVYRQTFLHRGILRARTGFLAAMRLEEWHKGIVLPHEATMSGPKMDRLQLMRATAANSSPIFALYEDPTGNARALLDQIVAAQPTVSFADRSGEHQVWTVSDQGMIEALAAVPRSGPVYVADGHHRYETALYYRDEQRAAKANYHGNEAWNFVLTLLVAIDDPGLTVLPTHRLVNPQEGDTTGGELAGYFAVQPLASHGDPSSDLAQLLALLARHGERGHAFGIYGGADEGVRGLPAGGFALLGPRSEEIVSRLMPAGRAEAWRQLDVSVLHELLLRRAFGLGEADFEDEARVAYTRDEEAALLAVDAGRYRLALFLNPTPVRQVIEVARAREVMPHKSTYFHPKPLTGIVLSRLSDVLA